MIGRALRAAGPSVRITESARLMLRNSTAVFSTGATARAVGFIAFILISRALAPAQLGVYALVLAAVEVVRQLTDGGIGTATVKRLKSTSGADREETIAVSLLIRGVMALVGYGIITAVTFHPALVPHRSIFLIAGLTLFTNGIAASLIAPFQAALQLERLVRLQLGTALASLLVALWGVHDGWGIRGFVSGLVAVELMLVVGVAVLFASRYGLRFRRLLEHGRPLAREALALGVLGLVVLLYFRLDVFMLQALVGAEAVGQYSLAFRISEACLLLAAAVSASTFPRYVELARNSPRELQDAVGSVYRVGVLAATAVAFGVTLVAPAFLAWATPQYEQAGLLTAVLIWSTVFMFANIQTADLLIAVGRTRAVTAIASGNLVLNVAANLLLIPLLGALGAVVATLLTEGVNTAVQCTYVKHRLGIALPTRVWALGGAAAATCLASTLAGVWVLAGAALALALFTCLVLYATSDRVRPLHLRWLFAGRGT